MHALFRAISGRCRFFFQAEDGIRDDLVTGVQTCALPISKLLTVDRLGPYYAPARPPWALLGERMTKADLVEKVTAQIARTAGPLLSHKDCAPGVDSFLEPGQTRPGRPPNL